MPEKKENRIEVEIKDGLPCPACGSIGAHYCPGKNPSNTVYVGVRKKRK